MSNNYDDHDKALEFDKPEKLLAMGCTSISTLPRDTQVHIWQAGKLLAVGASLLEACGNLEG